ncbi:MAG: beta-ketoacyl-[acyl-carrier-protein] synthase family protein [Acidimicrobiales bacterium]
MSTASPTSNARRAVVTGIGVLSGAAVGADAFWAALLEPAPEQTARRLVDFDPKAWLERRLRRHTDPFAQLAAAAADLARRDADLDTTDPERTAVVLGTGNGSAGTAIREYLAYEELGPAGVSPLLGVLTMSNAAASVVALLHQARGTTQAISSGCASGTHAVGEAARLIKHGYADVVFTGAAESFYAAGRDEQAQHISGAMLAGLTNLRVLTRDAVSRPFDVDRDGFVPADGACVLVLEDLDRARARGARIYAEVCGYGNTNDAGDLIAPAADGDGVRRAMELAIAEAGAEPGDVGFVNTHGTATVSNDQAEATAIAKLFGSPGPAVNSIKGTTGHSGPAAGALEAGAVALAIHHRLLPPTGGLRTLDPDITVDVVQGAPRPWEPRLSLSTSLGLGGHNGAVALRPVES